MLPSTSPSITLWATRPARHNVAWAERLRSMFARAHKAEVKELPLLAIVPLGDQAGIQAIKSSILKLDEYAHVIFVSQNAVAEGFEYIHDYWPQLPTGVKFYGVGAKTIAAIAEQGAATHTASGAGDNTAMNSEGLLTFEPLQHVAQQKILICRGHGGRPKLAEVLASRGAKVDYCELYERAMPTSAADECSQVLAQPGEHIVPVFSGDTLKNLLSVWPNGQSKSAIKLVLPAEHVAQMARDAGFRQLWVARNASEDAMLQSIAQAFS